MMRPVRSPLPDSVLKFDPSSAAFWRSMAERNLDLANGYMMEVVRLRIELEFAKAGGSQQEAKR